MMARKPATPPQSADTSVQRLVESAGIELRSQGTKLVGPCPRHPDDDNPIVIHPEQNTWECKSCGKQGGPVEWVMHAQKVSRTKAIDILADAESIAWPDDDSALLGAVVDYYHQTLVQDQEALEYLARRGLGDDRLIRHLRIGYANRTLGYRLPSRHSGAGKSLRARLESLGILRPTGHEHMSGSITVPVLDESGTVVNLYGRKVSTGLRAGTPLHLFLNETPPAPWLLDPNADDADTMIVTGSVMDALSWRTSGFPLVLITPTTDQDLGAILARNTIQRVVFAYPRQRALAAPITGAEVFRVIFPEGKDANDLLTEGHDLQALVRNAEWISGPPASAPEPARHDEDLVPLGDEVVVELGERRWRIRGLSANKTPETMRVNVMVTRDDGGMHVDTFDVYSSRHRAGFIKEAVVELGLPEQVVKADLGKVLVHLEELQDKALTVEDPTSQPPKLTPQQQDEALALLKSPDLINRIADDVTTVGLVGEDANKLIVYLAATSRLLHDPLAVVIQSTSGSGKSTLLDGVLRLMPDEAKKSFSAMTGQSLYYLGQDDLKHRILSVSEEQGASRASYSLKLLQSERTITIASTGKDPGTGRLKTETYTVEGPVALMMTTTSPDVDEELANRCVVVTVDESRDQTRAIHARQRHQETLDGLFGKLERDKLIETHRNAQRLLRPLHVVNPFADRLTFADHAPRTRRDHQKYLALIRAVALLYQHQRPVRQVERGGELVDYIEITPDDIKIANRLFDDLLGKSLDDLLPQTRRLLSLTHEMVTARAAATGVDHGDIRFTRRMLREHVGWGQTQLRVHLGRLVEMEYVLAHRAGSAATLYELAWSGEGQDGSSFVVGLADLAGQDRPKNGPISVGVRGGNSEEKAREVASDRDPDGHDPKKPHRGSGKKCRRSEGQN